MSFILPEDYWTLAAIVVPVATVYASVVDYRERRVPNRLNGLLAVMGIAARFAYAGWSGVGSSCAGLAVGLGMLILPWAIHAMGAGDVKLMAAVGTWLGPWLTFLACVTGMVIGGVIALVMILISGNWAQARDNLGVILAKCTRLDTAFSEFGSIKSFGTATTLLPYGIPLTIGSLIVLCGRVLGWSVLL